MATQTHAGAAITNYTDPSIASPFGITTGPDGALWFTNSNLLGGGTSSIGHITTDGTVTSFTDPTVYIADITTGPDGALWYTNDNTPSDSISRITTDGTITKYADRALVNPQGITVAPDGALWFADLGNDSIGRVTTAGTFTFYTDPTINKPSAITVGPDGALWFTNLGNNSIGRITTSGVVTNFTDPTINTLGGITAGPDGALWFVNEGNSLVTPIVPGSIGRITTDGTFTFYTDPTITFPTRITSGPDRALWFTNLANNSIGRITTPRPVLVPSGGGVTEGTAGTTSQLDITVTLSHPSPQNVTTQWNTAFINGASDLQAIPGTDYIAASGTVTFPPGETTETVPITVLNHDFGMPYKLMVVSFHNLINATPGGYWGLAFGFLINNTR